MSIQWGQYAEAYKAIHDKLVEILAKLDNASDPQLVDVLAATVTDLKRITRVEWPVEMQVANFGQVMNGDFESYQRITQDGFLYPGWFHKMDGGVTPAGIAFSGFKAVWLKNMGGPDSNQGLYQFFSPAIPTNYIRSFTLMYWNYDWDPWNLYVKLFYSDGTTSLQTKSMSGDMWDYEKLDITFDANKFIVMMQIYTNCTLASQIYLDTVSLNYESLPQIPINLLAGQQTVAAAGTPVALGSGAILHSVLIQPIPTNTGNVMVGKSGAGNQVFVLTPTSEPIRVFAKDLGDIYVDASVNGEGVNYIGG